MLFSACSGVDLADFQQNSPDPDFTVFTLVEGYPTLEYIWDNMNSSEVNEKLSETMDVRSDEFVRFSSIQADIMRNNPDVLVSLVGKASKALETLLDTEEQYYYSPYVDSLYQERGSAYLSSFYALLERISNAETDGLRPSVMNIVRSVLDYIVDTKDKQELNSFMATAIASMSDMEREDFTDLTEMLGKMLMSANYPIYLDMSGDLIADPNDIGSGALNTDLGNMTAGVHTLLLATAQMVSQDEALKERLFGLLDEVPVLYGAQTDNGKGIARVLTDLITNIEGYYLADDGDNTPGDRGDYYRTGAQYINSELKNTIKEILPAIQKLMISAGKPGSVIRDPENSGRGFLEVFLSNLKTLGWDDEKIAAMDFDNDLVNMVRYDGFGRDRLDSGSGASDVSYLDHTIFTLLAASNYGYREGGGHSRGAANGGMITLNDCLQNQGVYSTMDNDPYTMCLNKNTDGENGDDPGNKTFRSSTDFHAGNRGNYKFFLKPSYPSNALLSGQCIGDGGLPNGGRAIGYNGGSNIDINYWPYNGNGTGEMNTALWSVGWITRTCWKGEGPYYYGTPNEEVEAIEIAGNSYQAYMRPDGNIYAYIYKADESDPSTWEYVYPDDAHYDAPVEAAVIAAGKTKNYAEFRTDGGRYGGGYVFTDRQKLTVRMGETERGSFSKQPSGTFATQWTTGDTISAINGLGFSGDSLSSESGQVRIKNSTGPMAFVNDGNTGVYPSLYNMIWTEGTYSGATNHSVYVACNKYIVKSDSSIRVQIDDDVDVTLTFSAGDIFSISQLISRLQSEIGSDYVKEVGYYDEGATGSSQKNVTVYPDSKDNFKNDSWWQYFIEHDAPTIDKHFKIVAKAEDYRVNRITITNNYGSAIEDLFNISLSDGASQTVRCKGRENRYKQVWNTDHYMFEIDGTTYAPNNWSGMRASQNAGTYTMTEKIAENPSAADYASGISRECSSQEEAMYKNYQYLMGEKKIIYVIPMLIDHTVVGCVNLKFVVNCLVEANGVAGLSNARKYGFGYGNNGKWIKTGATGDSTIPGDGRVWVDIKEVQGNDLLVAVHSDTIFESVGNGFVLPSVVGYNMAPVERMAYLMHATGKRDMNRDGDTNDVYDNVLEIPSMDAGVNGPYYNKRSKAFPLIVTLMGTLDGLSHYDRTGEPARDVNISGNHKKPLKLLTHALLPALAKPMFYYNTGSGSAPNNCWKPRITGNGGALNNDYTRVVINKNESWNMNLEYFTPKYYRTLTGMLFESGPKAVDGMVPLMAKSKMGTKTIQLLNGIATGDPAIYGRSASYNAADKSTWGIIKKLSWALEQLTTGMKATKGEAYTSGYLEDIYESWQYATGSSGSWANIRDCDIVLDDMLDDLLDETLADLPDSSRTIDDEVVGNVGTMVQVTLGHSNINSGAGMTIKVADENGTLSAIDASVNNGLITGSGIEGYGRLKADTGEIYFVLAEEPEGKVTVTYTYNHSWQDFYDLVDDLGAFIEADSEYYIFDDLVSAFRNTLDALTYDESLNDELKGALYTFGKLFARYDGSRWVYQGEEGFDFLYTMLKEDLSSMQRLMLDSNGENIESVMLLIREMVRSGGLVDAILDSVDDMNVTDAFEWDEIFGDLSAFLQDPLLTDPESDLWPVLANMMEDMADAIESSGTASVNGASNEDLLRDLYEQYGFQSNR